jgi:hypothetical protein
VKFPVRDSLGQLPEQSGKQLDSQCPEAGNPLPTTSGTTLAMLHSGDAFASQNETGGYQAMTVSGITSAIAPNTPQKEAVAPDTPAQEPVTACALVVLERAERISVFRSARPDASFVAHLIAMVEHTPQTRALRRTTPAAAQAIYDHAAVRRVNGYGRVLSQIA